jgi:hypothetical protein
MKKFQILLISFLYFAPNGLAQRAQQADEFVDSVGINTHLTYTNTAYASAWPQVLAALKAMHIRHIRDGFYPWASSSPYFVEHQQLHAAGINCDFVVATIPTAEQVATFREDAGDMAYLEAPNEADDQNNSKWATTLHQELPALYEAGAASGIPVLGPSLVYKASYPTLGDVAADMNYNNLHIYFGGRNPGSTGWGSGDAEGHAYGSILWWLDNAQVDAPGVPSFVSESGYIANPKITPYTLPQDVEAKYAQRTLLEMFNAGIVKSYFYELVDEVTSTGYGMMTSSVQPKLAYNAVTNLLGLLEDPGSSFQPGALSYTLTGAASDVHHLLLQKRNGTFYLVLWIEASGYNEAANVATPVASQNVQLALSGATAQTIYAFNDQGGYSTTAEKNPSALSLTLNDTVTIVQITNTVD